MHVDPTTEGRPPPVGNAVRRTAFYPTPYSHSIVAGGFDVMS